MLTMARGAALALMTCSLALCQPQITQEKAPWIVDGAQAPVFGRVVPAPDGNTMTGTLESSERTYYRVVRVWKRQ